MFNCFGGAFKGACFVDFPDEASGWRLSEHFTQCSRLLRFDISPKAWLQRFGTILYTAAQVCAFSAIYTAKKNGYEEK